MRRRVLACNVPVSAPPGDRHKYVVLACAGGRRKLVRFGARGYEDFLTHRDPARRRNFKRRHRCNLKQDRLTSGWWSCNWSW